MTKSHPVGTHSRETYLNRVLIWSHPNVSHLRKVSSQGITITNPTQSRHYSVVAIRVRCHAFRRHNIVEDLHSSMKGATMRTCLD